MATFDQAYWYTNDCPLRKRTDALLPPSECSTVLRGYLHSTLLDAFKEDPKVDIVTSAIQQMDVSRIRRGLSSNSITRDLHRSLVNFGIWRVKHSSEDTLIDKDICGTVSNMDFTIDIARFKSKASRIQLVWFCYDSVLPSMDDFTIFIEKAQWNARAFEILTNQRPMQLSYFFPLIGVEYSVLYNTESGYEHIANLIEKETYYMKPNKQCDICTQCPMTWAGYLGKFNNDTEQ